MGVTGISHVLVLSDDIDRTRDFYERALGLEPGERPPLPFPGHWMYAGGEPCIHIADRTVYREVAARMGLPLPGLDGGTHLVDHIAFNATDYAVALQRLEREGVTAVRNEVPAIGMRQLFFQDPEGVRIEVNVL